MNTNPTPNQDFTFTGKHMLLTMMGFFGVIIAVNITMAVMASKSWTGLVVKNSYVASQQFNGELERARQQREAGFVSTFDYASGTIRFELKNAQGDAVILNDAHLETGRPAFEQADRVLPLGRAAGSRLSADVELGPGIWSVKITGRTGDLPYRRDLRLVVDASGSGRVQ